ncbi:MAG: alpha/beta hydrolase [Bacteroidota bacterium]
MTSFNARTVNFLMRNRHLFQGKLKKEVFDMNTSITAFREECEKGAARFGKVPSDVTPEETTIKGMHAEWLIPQGAPAEKVVMYVHGGGYVSGSCSDHRGVVSKFAKNTGFSNLLYEYRLAPEHPFPAAVEDSVSVYQHLLDKGYDPANILIAGESAGGGLTLATLLALKEHNLPTPVAAVAIAPWTDLTCSGDSYTTKNKRSVAPLNSWSVFARHYAGNHPKDTPLMSPLFGDLAGLPPLFINSGMDDELFDDGRRFAEKAKAAGVDVTFRAGKDMVHCYPLLTGMFPEATRAMDEIVAFVKAYLTLSATHPASALP